jgi:hypothetical protein
MMRCILGLMNSWMKYQETHIEFKVKYNKKERLCSSTPRDEETSNLTVDSEEEDKEEVWFKVNVRLFVITVHIHDIWQGTVRTLVPLAATATHLNMLLKIVPCC